MNKVIFFSVLFLYLFKNLFFLRKIFDDIYQNLLDFMTNNEKYKNMLTEMKIQKEEIDKIL